MLGAKRACKRDRHGPEPRKADTQVHRYSVRGVPIAALVTASVAALLPGCGDGNPPEVMRSGDGPGTAQWTVLAYMDGDGDLEPAIIGDFNEMEVIGSTGSVNVIVQMDRHPAYDTTNGNWVTTRRFRVERDPDEPGEPRDGQHNLVITSPVLADIGEVNMGEEDTLVDFVEWGMREYPAKRYFLALVNHGWGWRPRSVRTRDAGAVSARGVIFDETSGMDCLSNAELRSALQRIKATRGRKLEILGLDVSEEALLEVAYQVRDSVDYLIASQLSEPNDGYPYDSILHRLTNHPKQPLEELLIGLLQDYLDSYAPGQHTTGAGSSVTQAVFRESRVEALADAVDQLAQALRAKLPDSAPDLVDIRGTTQSFSEDMYRDLYDFAERVMAHFDDPSLDALCQDVIDRIGPGPGTALVGEVHATGSSGFPTTNVDNAHGVMIYLPHLPTQYLSAYASAVDFAADTQWDEYISDPTAL